MPHSHLRYFLSCHCTSFLDIRHFRFMMRFFSLHATPLALIASDFDCRAISISPARQLRFSPYDMLTLFSCCRHSLAQHAMIGFSRQRYYQSIRFLLLFLFAFDIYCFAASSRRYFSFSARCHDASLPIYFAAFSHTLMPPHFIFAFAADAAIFTPFHYASFPAAADYIFAF